MKELAKVLAVLAMVISAAALLAALWPDRERGDDYIVLARYGDA